MRLLLTARHTEISPSLRKLVDARLARIERRLGRAAVSAQLVLWREKSRYVAELTLHVTGDHMLHGLGTTAGWSTSLTQAVRKVMQQADTVKGKWQERKRPRARRPQRRTR